MHHVMRCSRERPNRYSADSSTVLGGLLGDLLDSSLLGDLSGLLGSSVGGGHTDEHDDLRADVAVQRHGHGVGAGQP